VRLIARLIRVPHGAPFKELTFADPLTTRPLLFIPPFGGSPIPRTIPKHFSFIALPYGFSSRLLASAHGITVVYLPRRNLIK
jgi:hypothetical protein